MDYFWLFKKMPLDVGIIIGISAAIKIITEVCCLKFYNTSLSLFRCLSLSSLTFIFMIIASPLLAHLAWCFVGFQIAFKDVAYGPKINPFELLLVIFFFIIIPFLITYALASYLTRTIILGKEKLLGVAISFTLGTIVFATALVLANFIAYRNIICS